MGHVYHTLLAQLAQGWERGKESWWGKRSHPLSWGGVLCPLNLLVLKWAWPAFHNDNWHSPVTVVMSLSSLSFGSWNPMIVHPIPRIPHGALTKQVCSSKILYYLFHVYECLPVPMYVQGAHAYRWLWATRWVLGIKSPVLCKEQPGLLTAESSLQSWQNVCL